MPRWFIIGIAFWIAVGAASAIYMAASGRWQRGPGMETRRRHGQARRQAERGPYQKATFAAGCFWGVEEAFREAPGVVSTAVGYTGGTTENPSYEEVCTGRTGHAEAVEVVFHPAQTSYEALLELFWSVHDPTQINRQGPDVGSQYRSAVFYHTPARRQAAEAAKEAAQQSGRFDRPIATEITPAGPFYLAEEYHQRYLQKKAGQCGVP